MLIVADERTRDRLIDMSRELDDPWEIFTDVMEEIREIPYVQGYKELNAICVGIESGIDLLIEALRSAQKGRMARKNGHFITVLGT